MLPKLIKSILNVLIVLAVTTLLGKLFQIGTVLFAKLHFLTSYSTYLAAGENALRQRQMPSV